MSFIQVNGIKIFQFSSFREFPLVHGFFSRVGGISPFPYESLNTSVSTGDSTENIIENRRRIFNSVGIGVETLYDLWQTHSDTVVCTEKPRGLDNQPLQGDAIITAHPDVTIYMRFADCVPIMLYDPEKKVIGMVHAGWQGTVKKIVAKTVGKMNKVYGSSPKNIIAGIGPSIGPDHYEVGENVVEKAEEAFGRAAAELLILNEKSIHFDLWTANQRALEEVGVTQIEVSRVCTACNIQDWFSHRGEKEKKGKTGRFGAILAFGKG